MNPNGCCESRLGARRRRPRRHAGDIKAMVNGVSLHVPVAGGKMELGTWQGIYVAEHRARPHRREVTLQFLGCCGE
jgi:secondary thiamine-phosphate synthase enzyme